MVPLAVSGGADHMNGSDSIGFTSMCPTCGRPQGQSGLRRSDLQRLITRGHPVEGYCATCDAFWCISDAERAEIHKRLTG